jgi:sortase A
MGSRERLVWRALGWTLMALGLGGILWAGYSFVRPAMYRIEQREAIERLAGHPPGALPSDDEVVPVPAPVAPAVGSVIGRLEIPRIGLAALVAEGDDNETLEEAIGHLPDTPLPWDPGNSALAGHRDALFRPLADVRVGDVLRLTTSHGAFVYRIKETVIVKPEDVWVLSPGAAARELTLITCYPFTYIGHAPKRFIVKADAAQPVTTAAR